MGKETMERMTILIDPALSDRLRDYAYTARITIREAAEEAFTQYLAGKEIISRRKNSA